MTRAIARTPSKSFTRALGAALMLSLGLGLTATSAQAGPQRADYQNPASREEATGFFGGAVLGGLVGGPPGALLGAALGAFTGDGLNARSEVTALRTDLYAARLEAERAREQSLLREREYARALAELDRLRQPAARTQPVFLPGAEGERPGLEALLGSGLSVHFRTGSARIEAQYRAQLDALARLARSTSNTVLEISGYADRNGASEANRQLAQQRAEAIATYLQDQGIASADITTLSHGETQPTHPTQSLETDFFDRRVNVTLRSTEQQMLTHSPDID